MTREKSLERTKARKAKGQARRTIASIERASSDYEAFWIAGVERAKALHPSNWKG